MITEDGYILNLHRIPCGRAGCGDGKRQPVFLQHGILASSADWVISGPEKALAFILADLGYDVWLGNARGNTYSRHHINMSTNDKKYWDFSFHEMAIYDIPAEIDFIYSHRMSKMITKRKNSIQKSLVIKSMEGRELISRELTTRVRGA